MEGKHRRVSGSHVVEVKRSVCGVLFKVVERSVWLYSSVILTLRPSLLFLYSLDLRLLLLWRVVSRELSLAVIVNMRTARFLPLAALR